MPGLLSVGSRAQVMHGNAKKTSGGLTKSQLKYNKQGKIVSKKASILAKKNNRLVKAGYVTRKGVFGIGKMGGGGMEFNLYPTDEEELAEYYETGKLTVDTYNEVIKNEQNLERALEFIKKYPADKKYPTDSVQRICETVIGFSDKSTDYIDVHLSSCRKIDKSIEKASEFVQLYDKLAFRLNLTFGTYKEWFREYSKLYEVNHEFDDHDRRRILDHMNYGGVFTSHNKINDKNLEKINNKKLEKLGEYLLAKYVSTLDNKNQPISKTKDKFLKYQKTLIYNFKNTNYSIV